MKLGLHPNSLFAILLRSRWWLSGLIAFGVFALLRLFFPAPLAAVVAAPFLVITLVAGYRQLRQPGAKRIAATLERVRAMPWDGFRAALEQAFRREGYAVKRLEDGADLELVHEGRVTLVGCKRWKAVRTGIEPLREFDAASRSRGAHGRMYIAAGEVTDTARAFAAEKQIRLLEGAELARLLV